MRSLFLATAALIVLAGPVYAQTSGSYSGSNASSSTSSTSMSAGGNSGVNFSYSVSDPPADPNSTSTIRNNTQAPDVVISGANACGLPFGASTSIFGFGFGMGATPTDKGCEHRDDAAAMHALGHDDVAMGIMCEQADVSQAMSATGHPCPPVNQPGGQPVAYSQPIPTGDVNTTINQEVAVTPPVAVADTDYAAQHVAWCRTLDPNNHRDVPYIQYDCGGVHD